jgi:hypothetical protein
MPEGNFTGNLPEDETKCLGRGTDGVTGSAAMLLLGVLIECASIADSFESPPGSGYSWQEAPGGYPNND